MIRVVRLSIAPVKSTALHHPDEVRLESYGAVGNRRFYVAEPDGRLFDGTDFGPLVTIRADFDATRDRLSLRFPDGSVVDGDVQAVGEPVRTDMYGREVTGRVLVGPWAGALTNHAGRPLVLVRSDEAGAAVGEFAVSISGTASAAELAERSGRPEALDSRRFRMLVEVDGTGPHEEDSWIGRTARTGEALVRVEMPVARCVITTQDPSTGLKDLDTLKAIAEYRGLRDGRSIDFGVYGSVAEPGLIRVSDPVEVDPAAG